MYPRKQGLILAGIDPGTEKAGFAAMWVSADGAEHRWLGSFLVEGKGKYIPERLVAIHRTFHGLLAHYQPDVLVYEGAFINGRNPASGLAVAQALGALLPLFPLYTGVAYEGRPSSLRKLAGFSTANYEGLRLALGSDYPELDADFQRHELRRNKDGRDEKHYAVTDDQVSACVQCHAARMLVRGEKPEKGVALKWERPKPKPPRKAAAGPLATKIKLTL